MSFTSVIRLAEVRPMRILLLTPILAVSFAVPCGASAPDATTLEFTVASLRRSDPGRRLRTVTNGSVVIRRESLLNLVAWSYGIDSFRIIGPDWIHSTFYDINAKADGPTSELEIKAMLKTLLAQRLDLAGHLGTRPVLVVAMAVAKKGLKVRLDTMASGAFEMIRDGDRVSLRNATFSDLAHFLGADGTRVFDNTGVKGQFNISLNYKPYVDPNDSSTHAISAAWQEAASRQIGLRFQEKSLSVPVLMIDRVRREPTEN
jgi:uncharacterized protein (TIGR03435 family)